MHLKRNWCIRCLKCIEKAPNGQECIGGCIGMHLGMHWRGNLHRFFFPHVSPMHALKVHWRCILHFFPMHGALKYRCQCTKPSPMHCALGAQCTCIHGASWCIKTLGKTHPLGENAPKKWGEHSIFPLKQVFIQEKCVNTTLKQVFIRPTEPSPGPLRPLQPSLDGVALAPWPLHAQKKYTRCSVDPILAV